MTNEKSPINNHQAKGSVKEPMEKEKIFKITLIATFSVAFLFLIKNIAGMNVPSMISIGSCLALLVLALFAIKILHKSNDAKYLIVSIALIMIICVISIFSGESFSDDFPLYLAAIAVSGMYLRPLYPRVQIVLADVALVIQYVCAPQKAGEFSQFIMCAVIFNIAGFLFAMVIDRGRAYINQSDERAHEVEEIIASLAEINAELNRNFVSTNERISDIHNANVQVETQTIELLSDSQNIAEGVSATIETCDYTHEKLRVAKGQIRELNRTVSYFENVLKANEENIAAMTTEITSVKHSSASTVEVFNVIRKQMDQIVDVMGQLKAIAANTTMLALNASIEAARAGEAGSGFAVVASKVQELAIDSNNCSNEVEGLVQDMQEQVNKTVEQLAESTENVDVTLKSLTELNQSFAKLLEHFDDLYSSIESENQCVSDIETGFTMIQEKVSVMTEYTEKNQNSVDSITDAIKDYGKNMKMMEEDAHSLHQLAASMEDEINQTE